MSPCLSSWIFQFTPLREGRLARPPQRKKEGLNFNSRPSARGDAAAALDALTADLFQFTPLREGRHSPGRWGCQPNGISIHAPPRGATACAQLQGRQQTYFNSRPSARGDHGRNPRRCSRLISIHAPPRGATRGDEYDAQAQKISIHAPPRGATSRLDVIGDIASDFNSRPSARGDAAAPRLRAEANYFNSRPSARGDSTYAALCALGYISIHAPPRGATPASISSRTSDTFQFTPLREGRHPDVIFDVPHDAISIHAPPRGATVIVKQIRAHLGISIHAPPRGATIIHSVKGRYKKISIHAPPRGATRGLALGEVHQHFNSRPSARGDAKMWKEYYKKQSISIHAPPRGATRAGAFVHAGRDFNSRPSARGDNNHQ